MLIYDSKSCSPPAAGPNHQVALVSPLQPNDKHQQENTWTSWDAL